MKEVHGPLRLVIVLASIIVAMLIGGFLAPWLVTLRGEFGPTIAQAQSPIKAALAVAICIGACTALGMVVARLATAMTGILIVGCGVGAMTMVSAGVQGLVRDNSASLWSAAIETGVYALMIAAASSLVFRAAHPLAHASAGSELSKGGSDGGGAMEFIKNLPDPVKAVLSGALSVPVVWIIAQSFMKGQVLWAVILGSMAAGLVGRILVPHTRQVLLVASPCLFAAIMHGVGATQANGDLNVLFVERALWPTSLPMPLDYMAGTLIGISMGVGWAKSFMHEQEDQPRTQPASV